MSGQRTGIRAVQIRDCASPVIAQAPEATSPVGLPPTHRIRELVPWQATFAMPYNATLGTVAGGRAMRARLPGL